VIRDHSQEHLSAERIQAFLEGELPRREVTGIEAHLAACARCAGEVDTWRALFGELGDLPVLLPHEGFAQRVMTQVHVPEARPWAARMRDRLAALLPGAVPQEHVAGERLQDFVEGLLPARHAARVQAHLDDCGVCSKDALAWRGVLTQLESLERFAPAEDFAARVMDDVLAWPRVAAQLERLEHFAPSEGFAARVMAEVAIPAPARVPSLAPSRARGWLLAARESLSWASALVPHTRQAWAAISGVAVTPMATLGLLVYTVFSHPTLTPGALLSFAGWKVAEFASLARDAAGSVLLESAGVFRIYTFLESLVAAPGVLASGLVLFSGLMAAATWVLYKNLIATPAVDGHYARVSL
jgi:anti-sigma factor RsiW